MLDISISTKHKVKRRLLPFLFIVYFIAFLDRSSITYASVGGMDSALGLNATTYGLIAGIFFIGYFMFGVPGNMILEKIGARVWIGSILLFWGSVTVATGFVNSAVALSILRFLLGTAEAALFPGMTLIVTYWFLSKERAAAIALFMIAPPLANSFGAPVSTSIIVKVHQLLGLDGWRWLFILVGIPAIIMGFITFWYLDDDPSKAKWLSKDEKKWLVETLDEDNQKFSKHGSVNAPFKEAFTNQKVWRMTFINFFYVMGLYGITFWLPQMIKSVSTELSTIQVGWITAIPYLLGACALVINAKSSDKTGERIWHTAGGAFLAGVAFIGAAFIGNPLAAIVFLTIASIGIYAWSGPYWAITTAFDPRLAAVGLGIVNAVGNLGGFISPYFVGWLSDLTNSNSMGMVFLAISLILAGCLVLTLKKDKEY
ncbi:MFS transporter [Latilactobacillus curvatus]|uniref:MFS transporter n=1 Tax=Latilactobacillus curvatus TaxID=28038 RepID=A0AAC9Y0Y5_LATCU|nr:MFS transporter [Latilactobacillus curvatus]ASN60839.1 MFS transporter [Latilactobacillus curvatus]